MRSILLSLLACVVLAACSGVEVIPDDTATFEATGYTRYAWRSDPLPQKAYSKDRLYQADPAIRAAVDSRLEALGYRRVNRDQAQFLVDYLAASGLNEGQLARGASNISPIPTAMINRQVGQAEVDNAYALGGVKETGNIALVFLNSANQDLLWKVMVTALVQNANQVDVDALKRAMRKGLSSLPAAAE